jgi:hypothetical protein
LQRQEVLDVILGVLGNMQMIFEQAMKITEHYRQEPSTGGQSSAALVGSSSFASAVVVAGEHARVQAKAQQQKLSARKRMRWVFQDRAMAEKLLNDLRNLNDGLLNLIPIPLETSRMISTLAISEPGKQDSSRCSIPLLALPPNEATSVSLQTASNQEQNSLDPSDRQAIHNITGAAREPTLQASPSSHSLVCIKIITRQLKLFKE